MCLKDHYQNNNQSAPIKYRCKNNNRCNIYLRNFCKFFQYKFNFSTN